MLRIRAGPETAANNNNAARHDARNPLQPNSNTSKGFHYTSPQRHIRLYMLSRCGLFTVWSPCSHAPDTSCNHHMCVIAKQLGSLHKIAHAAGYDLFQAPQRLSAPFPCWDPS